MYQASQLTRRTGIAGADNFSTCVAASVCFIIQMDVRRLSPRQDNHQADRHLNERSSLWVDSLSLARADPKMTTGVLEGAEVCRGAASLSGRDTTSQPLRAAPSTAAPSARPNKRPLPPTPSSCSFFLFFFLDWIESRSLQKKKKKKS